MSFRVQFYSLDDILFFIWILICIFATLYNW
jgi:hypothetical protein